MGRWDKSCKCLLNNESLPNLGRRGRKEGKGLGNGSK
jgi:hypothetical protein